jgi:ATP-binding cassette subfamily B protein
MGRQDATRQEVVEAAKAACCHEFIERLPKGYKTKIGEGGTYLSGGEAQRVSIARAILKNAPILVLDEATAFADPENEVNIQRALSVLIKKKTVIVIAHRLSTIKHADQILVIKEGEVVERGKHNELIEIDGVYKRMWHAHMDAGEWTIESEDETERRQLA